jgi:hypothetical protein
MRFRPQASIRLAPFVLAAASLSVPAALGQQAVSPTPTPSFLKRLGSTAVMPLPPELQGDGAAVVKAGAFSNHWRPLSIKPYRLADFKRGDRVTRVAGDGARFPRFSVSTETKETEQRFSYRVEKDGEGAGSTVLGDVACRWEAAERSADASRGKTGFGFQLPIGTTLACDVSTSPGGEPWSFVLWADGPPNAFSMDMPSGGTLSRGEDEWYEVESTNETAPLGVKGTTWTGTLFTREWAAVAAVKRIGAGRILLRKGVDREQEALFVSLGAAILVFDRATRDR